MNRSRFLVVLTVSFLAGNAFGTLVTAALAQQPAPAKVYTFSDLTPADVALLGKGLVKLPYEEVAPLLAKLQKQINEQDQPSKVEEPKK